MAIKTVPMSRKGYRNLKAELEKLEMEEWPAIVKEIEIARAHGDLSENAEYQYAKDKQGHIDAKIRQIKDKLARAEIIEQGELEGDAVAFGATVQVKNVDTDAEQTYSLVGPEETDVLTGKISIKSPVGQALITRKVGDVVEVQTPGGVRKLEILTIEW